MVNVVVVTSGAQADGRCRLELDYPYSGGARDAIADAVEAAENAGFLHDAIDRVEVIAEMRDK